VLNVWLVAFIGFAVALARPEETSGGTLAARSVVVVVVGTYLARLKRTPGWLPRA